MVRCMTGKTSDFGPTGITVTHRVAHLRGDMSYAELSRRLEKLGQPIPPLGLRRIEEGARRVDVDDLMALAAALGVSPITLLMPDAAEGGDMVEATGVGELRADSLWYWMGAVGPWESDVSRLDRDWFEFMSRAAPEFLQRWDSVEALATTWVSLRDLRSPAPGPRPAEQRDLAKKVVVKHAEQKHAEHRGQHRGKKVLAKKASPKQRRKS